MFNISESLADLILPKNPILARSECKSICSHASGSQAMDTFNELALFSGLFQLCHCGGGWHWMCNYCRQDQLHPVQHNMEEDNIVTQCSAIQHKGMLCNASTLIKTECAVTWRNPRKHPTQQHNNTTAGLYNCSATL